MTSPAPDGDPCTQTDPMSVGIVTVRPAAETLTLQKLPYFVGISQATAGAKGISLNRVVIPTGGDSRTPFSSRLRNGY